MFQDDWHPCEQLRLLRRLISSIFVVRRKVEKRRHDQLQQDEMQQKPLTQHAVATMKRFVYLALTLVYGWLPHTL